jgi:hypothetical protein
MGFSQLPNAVAAVPGRNFDPYERAIFERLV